MGGADGGKYWINGDAGEPLKDGEFFALGDFLVKYRTVSSKQTRFRIDFGNGDVVSLETFKDFVAVNIHVGNEASFSGAVGLMGAYPSGSLAARDGPIVADAKEFATSWQVLPTEGMIFHDLGGGVHHPTSCVMPAETMVTPSRRLGESLIKKEDAAVACAHAAEDKRDGCIADVLATNDKEMAGAY